MAEEGGEVVVATMSSSGQPEKGMGEERGWGYRRLISVQFVGVLKRERERERR